MEFDLAYINIEVSSEKMSKIWYEVTWRTRTRQTNKFHQRLIGFKTQSCSRAPVFTLFYGEKHQRLRYKSKFNDTWLRQTFKAFLAVSRYGIQSRRNGWRAF